MDGWIRRLIERRRRKLAVMHARERPLKMESWSRRIFYRATDWFREKFPESYFMAFVARGEEMRPTRRLVSSMMGMLVGIIIYHILIDRLHLPGEMRSITLMGFITFVGVSYTWSVQLRAIYWLAIPTFVGKSLRNFLVIAFLSLV
jgi:hypothetical protein